MLQLLPLGKESPVPTEQKAGQAPGPAWIFREKDNSHTCWDLNPGSSSP
jgi:hypothetical protein